MAFKKYIKIYTDGSCLYKTRKGGIGVVLLYEEHLKYYKEPFYDTTIGRMELTALIKGLSLIKPSVRHSSKYIIKCYSDSMYVVNCINKRWLWKWPRPYSKKNPDLLEQLRNIVDPIPNLQVRHVKGHSGNEFNEIADNLAGSARKSIE